MKVNERQTMAIATFRKKDNAIYSLLLSVFVLILFLVFSNFLEKFSFAVSFIYIMNLFLWCVAYALDDRPKFSLYKTCLMFILVFLIIAPASQKASQYFPWGYIVDELVEIIALFFVTIWIFSMLFVKMFLVNKVRLRKKTHAFRLKKAPVMVLLILLVLDYLILQRYAGFQNIFIKGMFSFNAGSNFDIAIDFLLKTYPILGLILIRKDKQFFKRHFFSFALFLFSSLLFNNPLTNGRFLALTVMLGIFFIVFPKALKFKFIDLIILLSICVLFPMASQFKTSSTISFSNFSMRNVFLNVDFDAFAMIEQGVVFHFENGNLFGKQIISSIFFFIPRNILPIKGTPSGAVVINALHPNSFDNVSFPLISEGLIDFGLVGVISYCFLFSYLLVALDNKAALTSQEGIYAYIYPLLFGYVIYICRGALAPTVLRLFGLLLPFIIYYVIMKLKSLLLRYY